MRVAGQPCAVAADLAAEVVEIVLGESTLEERSGVHARRGMALDVDVVAGLTIVLAVEEVVVAHLVQRGGAGEGRQVTTDAIGVLVGAGHHHRGVPADEGADAAFDVIVAGEPRLALARDGVHVRRGDRRRERHLRGAGFLEQFRQ